MPDERALTDAEIEAMERLEAVMTDGRHALLRCTLDGDLEVAVVTWVEQDGDEYALWPLAVLVDETLMERLTVEGVMPTPQGAKL